MYYALIFIFVLCFYGGTNFYIGKRIFQFFGYLFPSFSLKGFVGIFSVISLSIVVANLIPFPRIKGAISWIGAYWMGIYAYLCMFFLISDGVILLGKLFSIIPNPVPQRLRFYATMGVVALTMGMVGYGIYNAKQIKHVSYTIQLREMALKNEMKIVLISDLHLGAVHSEKRIPKIVQEINHLEPDLVCIVGDIFNDDFHGIRQPDQVIDLLKGIKAKYGVYASLGNHDGGKTFNEMVHFLEESNIKLLMDEQITIDDRLILIGRIDPSPIGGFGEMKRRETREFLTSINTDLPIVVMDHTPSRIDQYGSEVDLVLSGHTHRGQIFPFHWITNAIFTLDYGYYHKDDKYPHFIVTSGVGTWGPPMRIGSNCEIVSITLR